MTPERWRRVGELFHESFDIAPAERGFLLRDRAVLAAHRRWRPLPEGPPRLLLGRAAGKTGSDTFKMTNKSTNSCTGVASSRLASSATS